MAFTVAFRATSLTRSPAWMASQLSRVVKAEAQLREKRAERWRGYMVTPLQAEVLRAMPTTPAAAAASLVMPHLLSLAAEASIDGTFVRHIWKAASKSAKNISSASKYYEGCLSLCDARRLACVDRAELHNSLWGSELFKLTTQYINGI